MADGYIKLPLSGGGVPPGGTTGEVLTKLSNADGDADWGPVSGTSVSSVNGQTGSVVLTTTNISEGTRKYYTDERVDDRVAALIIDSTTLAWTYDDVANTLSGAVKWPLIAPEGVSPNPVFGFGESGNDTGWGSDGDGAQYWSCNNQEVMRLTNAELQVNTDVNITGNISAANYPPTGTAYRVALFNGSGDIATLGSFQVDPNSLGLYMPNTTAPNNLAVNLTANTFNLDVQPLQASPSDSVNGLQLGIALDQNNSGFAFGTGGRAATGIVNNIFAQNTGDVGGLEGISTFFGLGNGTDPINVRGLNYALAYANVQAGVNFTQNVNGYYFAPGFDASVTLDAGKGVYAFIDAFNSNGGAMQNYQSVSLNPQIGTIANNCNFTAISINPTVGTMLGNSNANIIAINGNFGTMTNGMNGIAVNPTITDTTYFTGLSINPNIANATANCDLLSVYSNNVTLYAGVKASLAVQDITYESQTAGTFGNSITIEYTNTTTAGNEVATLTGGQHVVVSIESGVSTATQVVAALNANFTIAANLNFPITGTASNPQVTYAETPMSGGINPGTKRAAYFQGDVQIDGALSFTGALSIGSLTSFAPYTVVDGGGNPGSANSLICQPTVAANVTIANADTLGLNTAALISIGDNAAVTTAFLGITALGLPAVLNMGTGSTIDRVAGAVFALSLDAGAGGGTADTVALCRALAIPNGVTTVNRLYGYEMALPFGDPGTVSWGLYIDGASQNWLAGALRIGGTAVSDDTAAAGLALQVTGDARFDDQIGFYGTTPVAQPVSSGAQTAGGTYGATEQTMLQEVYDAVRALGLMT